MSDYTVRLGVWPADEAAIRQVRQEVFIEEQHVTQEEEWDGLDPDCVHAIAFSARNIPVGTGRLKPDGQIGRMAVVKSFRGKNIGAKILQLLITESRKLGLESCYLHSQVHALAFYTRFGFEAFGEEFMDADIPHRAMKLRLK